MNMLPAVSLVSVVNSTSIVPLSIEQLTARASYNKAYKEANQQKIELGAKRLKMHKDELNIKRKEVKIK